MRKLIILGLMCLILFPTILLAKAPEDRIKEKDLVGIDSEKYFSEIKEAGIVVEKAPKVFELKVKEWKDIEIADRIEIRIVDAVGNDTVQAQKILDKTETETSLQEKKSKIVDEEVTSGVQDFVVSITPTPIPALDLSHQLLHLDLNKITVQELATLKLVITFPETMKLVLANTTPQDIPKLAILIYDFGYQAEEMNKKFVSVAESEKLKSILRLIPSQQYPIVKFNFLELTNDSSDIYFVDCSRWVDIKKMQSDIQAKDYKLIAFMSENKNNTSIIEMGGSVKDYKAEGRENFEIPYMAAKAVRPNVPVGFIVVMFPDMDKWLSSFTIQPDCWLLFNVPAFGANWQKVKSRWFKDRPVIANLNHHFQYHDYGGQQYGSVKYKETINFLKQLGYQGSIWWRTK